VVIVDTTIWAGEANQTLAGTSYTPSRPSGDATPFWGFGFDHASSFEKAAIILVEGTRWPDVFGACLAILLPVDAPTAHRAVPAQGGLYWLEASRFPLGGST
jgi:hypothetical protein